MESNKPQTGLSLERQMAQMAANESAGRGKRGSIAEHTDEGEGVRSESTGWILGSEDQGPFRDFREILSLP